ncbi:DUF3006 family protein [Rossellomorea vietnamensis]|uniref:DUF3006 family protein n=1 Tax=Rossellomorea vietnamensis TaxID=218284 RepID=A0A5D4K869_9BACI|nr:DUF3006 family protein [Rossellomorea vietnamensis]TYR73478.1 DUF3006 family protein [Rossellomorea vietnamensis]
MKKYTVDSIENNLVTLLPQQDESQGIIVSLSDFTEKLKEGDKLLADINTSGLLLKYQLLKRETQEEKEKNEKLLSKILKKNNTSD